MWAIDLTHTTHTTAQTGIQQACRNLTRKLMTDNRATPVVYDRYGKFWRPLDSDESTLLHFPASKVPGKRRSSSWSAMQKLRGWRNRLLPMKPGLPAVEGIFCPEIVDPVRLDSIFSSNLPQHLPRAAYFHDAIALQLPQWTPAGTVQHFPAYLRCLARFDHVACISACSEADLLNYWKENAIQGPPTSVIRLGLRQSIQRRPNDSKPANGDQPPMVLMVGTIEARKNHLALLQACEELWQEGIEFSLRLAGMLNRETGAPAARLIEDLAGKGRSLAWEGAVSNTRLNELFGEADIFAYPSLYEGFGLPVLEAMAHGLPVLTTELGALGELTGEGGCLTCDGTRAGIRDALRHLIAEPQRRRDLADEARRRPIRTMEDSVSELAALFQDLSAKPR